MLKVEVARGAEKSRRAAPRRWTVSGEGEGERHLEAARARLVVLREAARAELELAADLGIESARPELELARRRRVVRDGGRQRLRVADFDLGRRPRGVVGSGGGLGGRGGVVGGTRRRGRTS